MQLTGHKVLIPPTPATGTDLSKRVVPVLFVLCVTLCLLAVESFYVFYSARCLIVVWILSSNMIILPSKTHNVIVTLFRRCCDVMTSKQR